MGAAIETDAARARRIDQDRRRLEFAALAAIAGLLATVSQNAVTAYRLGHDPGDAAYSTLAGNQRISGLSPHVADAMTAANLAGRRRSVNEARRRSEIDPAILIALLLLDDQAQASVGAEYVHRAPGMVEGLASSARDAAALAAHPVGRLAKQIVVPEALAPEQSIVAELDAVGVTANNPYAVQRLYEDAIGTAYGEGRSAVLEADGVKRVVQGYRYRTMRDSRVRPNHRLMEGVSRPVDDTVWNFWTPPCGFNCRCCLLEVYEGEEFEPTVELPRVMPDPGWVGGAFVGSGNVR